MIELLLALAAGFALWPLWGMILFGIICLVHTVFLHNNRWGAGTGVLLGGAAILAYMTTGVNPFSWVWANLWNILLFIPGWLAIGGVWSLPRLYLFGRDNVKRLKKEGVTKRGRDTYWYNNKARITGWIIWWPFSMVSVVFGDLLSRIVVKIATRIWGLLSGIYAKIEKHVYKDFEDDPHGW